MEITNVEQISQITNLEELQDLHHALLEKERRRGREDLYFLCKKILGYEDMEPLTHKPVCFFAQDDTKRKKHIQLPRGSFKSSVITIGKTIQDIANDPNIRVLIDNEVYGNSKAFLREIKGHLETDRVQELYPHVAPNKQINDGFTEASVIVKGRTKPYKESTVSCAGLDQIKVGMHYDKIIMDDLVSYRNVTTREQTAKVIDHYKLALSLLEPEGELIVVGTRYHYSDLYGYLLENEFSQFYHMILPAKLNEEAASWLNYNYSHLLDHQWETGDYLFPERLTEKFLSEQRASQGTYIFNCQYMLNPIDQDTAEFQKEWIQYYRGHLRETPEGRFELNIEWYGDHKKNPMPDYIVPEVVPLKGIITAFDPANKKKKKTDFTGGVTIGIGPNNEWYLLNIIEDKFNPKQIVDRIILEEETFKPDITGIEEEGKESIKFYLVERMKQTNNFFRVKELKSGGVKKEVRIRRLIPRFENRQLFFPTNLVRKNWEGKTINLVDSLEDEIIYFPLAKKDNIIDALAYCEDLIPKRNKVARKRRKGRSRIIQ